MGAIAGIIYPDAFQVSDLVRPMLKVLGRRCNGSAHLHNWRSVELGSLGAPLGTNARHSIIVALDGHILNTDSLAQDLRNGGHDINASDIPSMLAHAYELWGTAFLERLDGDFALAILDEVSSQLILARDRIGRCPLYWYHDDHNLIFASELNALLATGAVPQTPAVDGIANYLSLGYFAQDLTPIEGVNKLLPAHHLTFRLNEHKSIQPYWSYSSYFSPSLTDPPARVAKHLDGMLQDSVEQQIASEASVGCLLSGGLGSASIAHYTNTLKGNSRVTAYTVGFEGDNAQDIQAASGVAQELVIPHRQEVITPDCFLKDLVKITWHLGEPIADPNILVTWRLARLASTETTTVLSGMGSDELLAGHSRYTAQERQGAPSTFLYRLTQPTLERWLARGLNLLHKPWALSLLRDAQTNPWQASYLKAHAILDEKQLCEASPNLCGVFDTNTFLHKFHRLSEIQSIVSSFLYFDVKTRLPEYYMLQYDRLTAAHGLHWRTPYLSRNIIEYLAGLPEPEQLALEDTASYLKSILRPHLSDAFVDRPKLSRPNFLRSWSETPELRRAFELLLGGTCVDTGYVSKAWLKSCLVTPETRRGTFHQLWAILMLEIWLRLFVTRPIHKQAPDLTVEELLSN